MDSVLYTHAHADHILGLDDLRPLSFKNKHKIPLYADDAAAKVIERIFDYTFSVNSTYPTRARVEMHRLGRSSRHSWSGFPSGSAHSWRRGSRRLSLWQCRVSHGYERHSGRKHAAAREPGGCDSRRTAPPAAPQPCHPGAGDRLCQTNWSQTDLLYPHVPRASTTRTPTGSYRSESSSPTTACISHSRSNHASLPKPQ